MRLLQLTLLVLAPCYLLAQQSFKLYPNPFSSRELRLEYHGPDLDEVIISIYDMSGQKVETSKPSLKDGSIFYLLPLYTSFAGPLNPISPGQYYLQVVSPNGEILFVERIICAQF